MRILILDTYYESFLESHHRAHPELADAPYEQQWRALMSRFFGTADSYSHYLGELGHTAHEVVLNDRSLQGAWARERGLRRRRFGRSAGWSSAVVDAQIEEFRPDVIYLQNLYALPVERLRELGRRHLVAGQIASESPAPELAAMFGLVVTSFPHFLPLFRGWGVPTEYLRIGFDRRVLNALPADERRDGAVFVGALGTAQHGTGNTVLERAAGLAPINIYGYGVEDWPESSPLRSRYRGEAWGLDMLRVLRHAKVALNRHIDVAGDSANNMRLYEATGVGTLLLTDLKQNLDQLFRVGAEVVAYMDADDLAAKIRHYLHADDERSAIAAAGQARTLAEHGYERRMVELAEILERRIA
jgi:spore maturation protein CgeB